MHLSQAPGLPCSAHSYNIKGETAPCTLTHNEHAHANAKDRACSRSLCSRERRDSLCTWMAEGVSIIFTAEAAGSCILL